MASDNVQFTKLSTEEPTEDFSLSFTPSSPAPTSFLVPSSSAIPPSPLVIPAHSLPLHVSTSILNTLAKETQPTQEHVIYCEAPKRCNGLKNGFFVFIVYTYEFFKRERDHGLMYAHGYDYGKEPLFKKWMIFLPSLPILFIAICVARFQFFGYRVVTNHRAALVIPRRQSAYFKPAMDKLMEGTLKESCCTLGNKLAGLYYQENKLGGNAVIYGEKKALNFGYVSDLKVLDDALSGAIHATATYAGIKLGSDLRLREEGSFASPHLEQLRFRTELVLLFVIPFLIVSGAATMFVLHMLSIFYCKAVFIGLGYSLFIIPTLFSLGCKLRAQRLSLESKRAIFIGSHSSPFWA